MDENQIIEQSSCVAKRFLLYIDILGFSTLVAEDSARIHDLYEVIASLNAHKHLAFKAIVFSDTILVYNTEDGDTKPDRQYLIMFLCEFAQDLQHRLTGRGIFFRAVLVYGEFTHYELNSMPCFFGQALIDAHKAEKDLKAIGLFIHKSIVADSDIFKTIHFNEHFDYVFITQNLDRVENIYGGVFPMDRYIFEEIEPIDHLVSEFLHLEQIHHWKSKHEVEDIRLKYANTWSLFQAQYPKTLNFLESTSFDWAAICDSVSWAKHVSRFPESYSWAIESKVVF